MDTATVPVVSPRERRDLSISALYSLAFHVLLICFLAILIRQVGIHSPTAMEITVVGLYPAATVNLGQVPPRSSPTVPDRTSPNPTAPTTAAQPTAQEAVSAADPDPRTPPMLTIPLPQTFQVPTGDRTATPVPTMTTPTEQNRPGAPLAEAPVLGPGRLLPDYHQQRVEVAPTSTSGRTALPPFIASQVPVTSVVVTNPTDPTISHGDGMEGSVQSTRQLIDRDPPPPVPDWLKKSGREPVVEYKVRMDRWGNFIGISVHNASGYPELDQQVMDHIKVNWHYEPGLGDEWRIVKVTYDLRPQ